MAFYGLLVSVITYYSDWLTYEQSLISVIAIFCLFSYPQSFSIIKVILFRAVCPWLMTYWVVVDVPYEAAQHGLLAHQGRHVDGGGLGVDQELPGLAVGGLGASWPQPLGNRARVPAWAWNMREWEGHVKHRHCLLRRIFYHKSALNLFIFICFIFSVTLAEVWEWKEN